MVLIFFIHISLLHSTLGVSKAKIVSVARVGTSKVLH